MYVLSKESQEFASRNFAVVECFICKICL